MMITSIIMTRMKMMITSIIMTGMKMMITYIIMTRMKMTMVRIIMMMIMIIIIIINIILTIIIMMMMIKMTLWLRRLSHNGRIFHRNGCCLSHEDLNLLHIPHPTHPSISLMIFPPLSSFHFISLGAITIWPKQT